jgi:hypothetical protein
MVLTTFSLGLATEALGQNAPVALRGKSIVADWTENRLQRREGGGDFRPRSIPNRLQVYISSEGRTFERRSIGSAFNEGVSGGAITGTAWGSHRAGGSRFQGNSLILAGVTRSGAARVVTITFASDFSTCSVRAQVGREVGSSISKGNALGSGRPIEFIPQGVTGESCSIQSGNIFAQ